MEARKPELSVSTDIVAPIDKSMPKGIYKLGEFGNVDIFLKPTKRVFKLCADIYVWLCRAIVAYF